MPGQRRRILFLTITFDPEPGALRGLPLARRLVASGDWDVTVVTAIPWYPQGRYYEGYRLRPIQTEIVDGVRVIRLPLYPSHDRSAARRIATYTTFAIALTLALPFLMPRPDVIYHVDNLPTTGLVANAFGAVWGAPVIQHIGDLWPDSVASAGMIRSKTLRTIVVKLISGIQHANYSGNREITVITEGFRRALIARGVQSRKVTVLPNWADEDRFARVPRDRSVLAEFGLEDSFNVLYAGNIGVLQALDVVVDGGRLLLEDGDIRLVIAGDGPASRDLQRRADAEGLNNIVFLGRLPVHRMAKLNAAADALLIHLKDEPFLHATVPSKTQVAMLAARPILIGARGDAAALVERARAGLVFEPENAESFAAAVRALRSMPADAREAMAESGYQFYLGHLSLDHGVRVMDRLFRQVLVT